MLCHVMPCHVVSWYVMSCHGMFFVVLRGNFGKNRKVLSSAKANPRVSQRRHWLLRASPSVEMAVGQIAGTPSEHQNSW